jgi:hypothetical protein
MYIFGDFNSSRTSGGSDVFHVVGAFAFVSLSPASPLVKSSGHGSVKLASPSKRDYPTGGVLNVPVSLYYHNISSLGSDWQTAPDLSKNPSKPFQTVLTDKDGLAFFDTVYFKFQDEFHCQFDFCLDFSSADCKNSPASVECKENGCG